jgi:hypothetical protein
MPEGWRHTSNGDHIRPRFWIGVVEDYPQDEPGVSLGYLGNWTADSCAGCSGGRTHVAEQEGAAAILRYEGAAAAWVTTADDSRTPARVVCDEELDPQGGFRTCAEVDTEDPDPGISGRHMRVAWAWPHFWGIGVNRNHTLRVISDDPSTGFDNIPDVDAFLVVHRA